MQNTKGAVATPPSAEWVAEQCRQFEVLLGRFTEEMRAAFRKRAEEGRDRWQDPEQAERLQMDLLAHAYHRPRSAGEEAHVANFACFLWGLRVPAAPAAGVVGGYECLRAKSDGRCRYPDCLCPRA